ncbi:MAG: hypothetical protein EP343_25980 [Deltaproteobacteria bacterium]|nr:MAG: hypothetical protein EP343_25980 [Deltaproteobacteria bacterium]
MSAPKDSPWRIPDNLREAEFIERSWLLGQEADVLDAHPGESHLVPHELAVSFQVGLQTLTRIGRTLELGETGTVWLECSQGLLLLVTLPFNHVLAVQTGADTNLGLLRSLVTQTLQEWEVTE